MTRAQILPTVIIAISLGAAFVYFACGDVRRGLYYLFAAAITATVTF